MTPKEKAEELVQRYEVLTTGWTTTEDAIQSALFCVDEKFKSIKDSFGGNTKTSIKLMKLSKAYKELLEVKQEINKI